jgi:hypothetical protein
MHERVQISGKLKGNMYLEVETTEHGNSMWGLLIGQ